MRLSFWSAKRLLPLYGILIVGTGVVGALSWLMHRFNAPEWISSALITAWAISWIGIGIRASILQARDNAAPAPDWLTGKPRDQKDG